MAQGKQRIWLLTFPDRKNTGNLGESILNSFGAKHQSPGIIHLLNVSHHLCVSEAIFDKHLGSLAII